MGIKWHLFLNLVLGISNWALGVSTQYRLLTPRLLLVFLMLAHRKIPISWDNQMPTNKYLSRKIKCIIFLLRFFFYFPGEKIIFFSISAEPIVWWLYLIHATNKREINKSKIFCRIFAFAYKVLTNNITWGFSTSFYLPMPRRHF